MHEGIAVLSNFVCLLNGPFNRLALLSCQSTGRRAQHKSLALIALRCVPKAKSLGVFSGADAVPKQEEKRIV